MDSIPHKLLDLPTLDTYDVWPVEEGFRYLGYGLRIDYCTPIHTADGSLESFFHDFNSGVRLYEPVEPGDLFLISTRQGMLEESRDKTYYLSPAVDPIVFGYVDRVLFLTPENRQFALVHPDVGLPAEDAEQMSFVAEMPNAFLAWDPEGRQLIVSTAKGETILVIREGSLDLTDLGMIIG